MTENSNSLMRLPDASGRLPERYTPSEASTAAMACRSITEVFRHATISQLCQASPSGRAEVGVAAMAIIERGMQYFAANRRLSSDHVSLFAEQVIDDFKHESLADLNVFMRKAAMGSYGGGETYGALDIPRLGEWWRAYLGEKADERERVERQASKDATKGTLEGLAAIPGIMPLLKQIGTERRANEREQSKIERTKRLQSQLPNMSDDELREAWKLYPTTEERAMIYNEAKARNLAQPAMERAIQEADAQTEAAA